MYNISILILTNLFTMGKKDISNLELNYKNHQLNSHQLNSYSKFVEVMGSLWVASLTSIIPIALLMLLPVPDALKSLNVLLLVYAIHVIGVFAVDRYFIRKYPHNRTHKIRIYLIIEAFIYILLRP